MWSATAVSTKETAAGEPVEIDRRASLTPPRLQAPGPTQIAQRLGLHAPGALDVVYCAYIGNTLGSCIRADGSRMVLKTAAGSC